MTRSPSRSPSPSLSPSPDDPGMSTHPSPLSRRYAELGLMKSGEAARALGVERQHLRGRLRTVPIEWKGQTFHGYLISDIEELAAKIRTLG